MALAVLVVLSIYKMSTHLVDQHLFHRSKGSQLEASATFQTVVLASMVSLQFRFLVVLNPSSNLVCVRLEPACNAVWAQ